jgi:hypothetical protein
MSIGLTNFGRMEVRVAYPKIVIAHTRHDEYQYKGVKIIDIAD